MSTAIRSWLLLPLLTIAGCQSAKELLYEPKPDDPNDGYEGSFAEAGINTEMDFGPKQSRLLDEHIRLKNDFSALQRRYDDAIVEKQNLLGQLTGEKSTLEREKALRAEAEAEAEMLRGRRRELEAKILSLSIEKAKLEQSALLAKIDALNASLSDVMSNPVDAAAPPPERR